MLGGASTTTGGLHACSARGGLHNTSPEGTSTMPPGIPGTLRSPRGWCCVLLCGLLQCILAMAGAAPTGLSQRQCCRMSGTCCAASPMADRLTARSSCVQGHAAQLTPAVSRPHSNPQMLKCSSKREPTCRMTQTLGRQAACCAGLCLLAVLALPPYSIRGACLLIVHHAANACACSLASATRRHIR